MGRRSINTTKSGKYMNPTDQARKEARKQELKKNKKQRQLVRAAVLKGKDPQQILEELEKIDQMEFNVIQPSPLNEKVLKDKRKKLRETLDRVLGMYHKDDLDKWTELKRRQTEYDHKRGELVNFFESVKSAQQVTVDEIPLPQLPQMAALSAPSLQIPLPMEIKKTEHTIYSIATALKLQALGHPIKEPPGCPAGPPPDINSDGEPDGWDHEEIRPNANRDELMAELIVEDGKSGEKVKPTSLQQKMVALSGQNVDEFMKEMEQAAKKKLDEDRPKMMQQNELLAPPGTDSLLPQIRPPMNINLFNSGGHLRIPPGPPPGRPLLPPGPPPGLPPRMPLRMNVPPRMMRLPGPPPHMPPPHHQQQQQHLSLAGPNVLSAAPQLIHRNDGQSASGAANASPLVSNKQSAIISAKPQIRNLSADVTRFVPSALRVKRDVKPKPSRAAIVHELKQREILQMAASGHHPATLPTKDDAYMQFMNEMQGLL